MSVIRVLDILVVSLISQDVRRTNSRRRRNCMMPSLAALQHSELGGTGAGTKREGEGVTREGQEKGPNRRCFFVVLLVFDGDFGRECGCGPEQNSRCARKDCGGHQHQW